MRSQSRNNPAGFSLVEVMMASVILVIGFVGMIEAVTLSARMMDSARRQTLASQIINHEVEKLRFNDWTTISGLPTTSTTVAIDLPFWPTWGSVTSYFPNNVVTYNGVSYRCIATNSGRVPPNATYWTAVTSALTTDIVVTQGATFTLARTVTSPDPVTNIREVNFTLTWVVTTSRRDSSNSPLTFRYTRSNSAWYGKYGLNLTYQRS